MNVPKTRSAAIAAKCKDCIHDPAASGNWKEQVSACTCIDCALWRLRPMSRTAVAWIKSRDPADLPNGWTSLHHDEAIRRLRGSRHDKVEREAPARSNSTRGTEAMETTPRVGTP
jgi:hypothetical protein